TPPLTATPSTVTLPLTGTRRGPPPQPAVIAGPSAASKSRQNLRQRVDAVVIASSVRIGAISPLSPLAGGGVGGEGKVLVLSRKRLGSPIRSEDPAVRGRPGVQPRRRRDVAGNRSDAGIPQSADQHVVWRDHRERLAKSRPRLDLE